MAASEDRDLESVRAELRRLGYLSHGFERLLLQDALRPRPPLRVLLSLALKVGLLAGLVTALVLAFALAAANGSLAASPFDLAVLFLHLFPAASAAAALGFLAMGGLLTLVLRLYPVRRIETLSFAAAAAAGAGALALGAWRAQDLLAASHPWQLAVLAAATPAVVYVLVKLVYHGLLTLAIRLTDSAPRGRLFSRRWLGLAILAAAFLLTLPAVLAARPKPPPVPGSLPSAPGERVLLLGIDGVLPEEADYLLALGELPALGRLAREGGAVFSYRRPEGPPASFWTSVATGRPAPDHGVTSLDSFLPLGAATPLARTGPLRPFWNRVEVPLGLAEYRPVLANRRSAAAVWELASRGGAPVLAVNWWATFPAEPLPGLVIAHGAYQLLAEGAAGAIAPESARAATTALAAAVGREAQGKGGGRLRAALPPKQAAAVETLALSPDRFYRQAFARGLAAEPRAAALYLPGLDIAAAGWTGGDVALADLVRTELTEADALLGRAADGFGTVAVVLDPGRRREGGEGRVLLWRRAGCRAGSRSQGAEIRPEAIAAGLLRALGLPQSGELPPPPGRCAWPPPPAAIPTFGPPPTRRELPKEGGEYLENLRSLGYL